MQLWSSRTLTYDVSMKHNFPINAALIWTINYFSAFGMVFGLSMHEKLACTYYMENNKAFILTNGCKTYFFLLSLVVLANGSHVYKEHK